MDPNKKNLFKTLSDEDCEDFYNYIDWLDLSKSPNIIVLPLSNHYYYQPEDFEKTETLVNLKCLNRMSNLRTFLGSIHKNLPLYCFFTGCFLNNNRNRNFVKESYNSLLGRGDVYTQTDTRLSRDSGFVGELNRIFDSKTNITLKKESVRTILKDIGFTILDMTELNNKTYFCAQKRLIS